MLSLDVLELIRVSKLLERVKDELSETAKTKSLNAGKKITCFSLSNVHSYFEKKGLYDSLGDTQATLQVLRNLRDELKKVLLICQSLRTQSNGATSRREVSHE